jgi:MoaA/NifB/PqqE/SkfB family radical SAM enzyme
MTEGPRRDDHPTAASSGDLSAPLYVAWQITNECNLACLHCIEESGPGKAFRDELDEQQTFRVLGELMDGEVPYLSFSGGEPMIHPRFFEMVEFVCARGAELKVETNGHYLSAQNCERLQRLGVKAVQLSLDGASRETFTRMRVRGEFNTVLQGARNLRAAGVALEINYSPTRFNIGEIGRAVDLAYELGPTASTPAARCTRAMRSRPGTSCRPPRINTPSSSPNCTGKPPSTAAACESISTKWGCSRS